MSVSGFCLQLFYLPKKQKKKGARLFNVSQSRDLVNQTEFFSASHQRLISPRLLFYGWLPRARWSVIESYQQSCPISERLVHTISQSEYRRRDQLGEKWLSTHARPVLQTNRKYPTAKYKKKNFSNINTATFYSIQFCTVYTNKRNILTKHNESQTPPLR